MSILHYVGDEGDFDNNDDNGDNEYIIIGMVNLITSYTPAH
jgi:hypothetical protein